MNILEVAMQESLVFSPGDEMEELVNELRQLKNLSSRDKRIIDVYDARTSSLPTINIDKFINAGGVYKNGAPKLGFARAYWETVTVEKGNNGHWCFVGMVTRKQGRVLHRVLDLHGRKYIRIEQRLGLRAFFSASTHQTLVPFCPPQIRPKGDLSDYFVVWEAKNWEPVPRPIDPYLLKHLHGNLYGIVATWDLTELEVEAMRMAR